MLRSSSESKRESLNDIVTVNCNVVLYVALFFPPLSFEALINKSYSQRSEGRKEKGDYCWKLSGWIGSRTNHLFDYLPWPRWDMVYSSWFVPHNQWGRMQCNENRSIEHTRLEKYEKRNYFWRKWKLRGYTSTSKQIDRHCFSLWKSRWGKYRTNSPNRVHY